MSSSAPGICLVLTAEARKVVKELKSDHPLAILAPSNITASGIRPRTSGNSIPFLKRTGQNLDALHANARCLDLIVLALLPLLLLARNRCKLRSPMIAEQRARSECVEILDETYAKHEPSIRREKLASFFPHRHRQPRNLPSFAKELLACAIISLKSQALTRMPTQYRKEPRRRLSLREIALADVRCQ